MVGAPAKKKSAFAKAASIPAWRQSENAGPRLLGFIFRRCPPSRIFSDFSSTTLKRHLLKRHLTETLNFRSVNRASVIWRFHILQRHLKPEITWNNSRDALCRQFITWSFAEMIQVRSLVLSVRTAMPKTCTPTCNSLSGLGWLTLILQFCMILCTKGEWHKIFGGTQTGTKITGHQNKRAPKCQFFEKTCHFDTHPFSYPFGHC